MRGYLNNKPCADAWVRDDQGLILMVQRAHEPYRGLWSLPGGHVELGEHPSQTVVRELREETGLIGYGVPELLEIYIDPVAEGEVNQVAVYSVHVNSHVVHCSEESLAVAWVRPYEVQTTPLALRIVGDLA